MPKNAANNEAIEKRAYNIWQQEGRPEGRHHDHWEQAQNELQEQIKEPEDEAREKTGKLNVVSDKGPKTVKKRA